MEIYMKDRSTKGEETIEDVTFLYDILRDYDKVAKKCIDE